jgi:hypothetical protein
MPGADRHAVVCVYQTNRDREVGELLLVELGGGPWPCWGTPEFKHPGTPVLASSP